MRVFLCLTVKDTNDRVGSITIPVDLNMSVLETKNGVFEIKEIVGMHIDCMVEN